MHDYLDVDTLSLWLVNYGSITLFILLALGIIALPVPEETLLTLTGILLYKGLLSFPITFLAALGGSICGITFSYIIGKTVGAKLLHRYGSWMGLTETRLQKAHLWFEKYGKWSLSIGYFIPGVRHFTGICAGLTELEYRYFALFAYSGALVWVSTFLSIGYFFGDYWMKFLGWIEEQILLIMITGGVMILLFLVERFRATQKR